MDIEGQEEEVGEPRVRSTIYDLRSTIYEIRLRNISMIYALRFMIYDRRSTIVFNIMLRNIMKSHTYIKFSEIYYFMIF